MSELAHQLIEENKRTKAPFLDLGNCSLTTLPEEFFELTWLTELNLSNYYWGYSSKEWIKGKNKGGVNRLVDGSLHRLNQLFQIQSLNLADSWLEDIRFLEKLTQLQSLDLGNNRIEDIRSLVKLTRLQNLNLRNNRIADYSFLEGLAQLRSLDLGKNLIKNIRFLEKLTQLQDLNLSDNWLEDIRFLEKLTQLQNLDLSENRIEDIRFLETLTQLQSLDLRNNRIKDISCLEKLTQLQRLDLRNNQIEDIRFLEKLTQLQSLDLSYNGIRNVRFLEKLTQLKSLDLRNNLINDIRFLEKLTQLQSLDLRKNIIKDIHFLEKLTQLQALELSTNWIENIHFPETLTQLQNLDLSENRIEDIRFLETLTQLQSLDLRNNRIKDISCLEKLTQLQNLDLSENRIEDIRCLEKLTQLQSLELSNNQIEDIRFLEKLTQLQRLDLRNNQIEDIRFLEKLARLQRLDLRNNQIEDIRFLEKLARLQSLNLSNNRIKDIYFLEKLTQLRSLDLKSNLILEFSGQILRSWPKLHTLYISGNPIGNVPKEHFDNAHMNALSKLRGYFASLIQGSLINDEAKLIVVGNTTAGKTSLMQFIREGHFEKTQNSTHGIALTRWSIIGLNSALQVNVWDFGGQEYYHATHRLFLDDHALYVVVWEVSTNKEEIELTDIYLAGKSYRLPLEHFSYNHWLASIRYYAPNSTILLVQNKTDKTGKQSVSDDCFKPSYNIYQPAYYLSVQQASQHKENSSNVFWTAFQDFKTNLIDVLKTNAAGYELGIGWVAIRDATRQLPVSQRWMKYAEFEKFCYQAVDAINLQFDASVEMEGLIAYLSGAASTIVYYADDVRLRDIVFLNPQWVTDTIYDILTYDIRERKDNPGEFTRENAKQLLTEKGIGELTDTFLNLMKKGRFELIFEKPNCPDEYIVPQYLPDTHDKRDVRRYRTKTVHSFTLYFPRFLPRSVFLRFMVRYGNLATEVYWKYGIVLEQSGIDILVECMFSKRKIRVAIEGNPRKRFAQELFEGLWSLSDQKPDIEVSINETDFIQIDNLVDSLNQVSQIKSKQGNWLNVEDFLYLLGKDRNPEPDMLPVPMPNTPEIFFSYSWGDDHETGESREKIVGELYKSLKNNNYRVVRDKMDLGYKGLISEFIKRIGKGDIVIVAISDKYLKSPYCMFELLEIYRNSRYTKEEFAKVVYPIRVENIALNKPSIQSDYFDYWDEREKEWGDLITKHRARVKPAQFEEYDKVRSIHNHLGDLIEHLSDMNSLTKELLSTDNFAEIKKAIEARIDSLKG